MSCGNIRFWHMVSGMILLLPLLGGCATPSAVPSQQTVPTIVWPDPPEPARIRYLRDIQLSRDIKPTSGVWNRLKEIFAGKKSLDIVRAYGLALDDEENLIIADPGSGRIHIYNLTDSAYRSLPHKKDPVELVSPIGVGHDGRGRIFVSDSAAGVVHMFDPEGRWEESFGEFLRPTGLAVNRALSRIYVVDTGAHKIRVYALDGAHLFDMGERGREKGEFNFPTNIALDVSGNIHVTDSMNFRVQAFDPDGRFLYAFGRAGDGPGSFSKARGLGVDSEGHIYVADATFDNVQIFDVSGRTLLYFGGPGRDAGRFYLPAGLLVDERDRIFVADSYNRRVQVFQYLSAPAAPPEPEPLPAPALFLGLGRGHDSGFVLEKSARTLYHFERRGQEIRMTKSYPFTVGKRPSETFPPVLKRVPEGIYYVAQGRRAPSGEQQKILLESFPLSPESAASRPMILIGAGDESSDMDALGTPDLVYLAAPEFILEQRKGIATARTPFVVVEELLYAPPAAIKEERSQVLETITGWKECWDMLDLDCYIASYSRDFTHDDMDLAGWKAYKRSIFSRKRESLVTLKERHIIKFGPYVLLDFLQDYRSPNYADLGRKQIVLRQEGNDWKIITEKWSAYEDHQ